MWTPDEEENVQAAGLYPASYEDTVQAYQALRDVAAGLGFAEVEQYCDTLDAEGPAILRRLPGMGRTREKL